MPYVGRDLQRGNYLKLDDLESQFNGSKTTFNLESGGSAFYPGSAYSILVSLGGIVQEPESAYTINQNTITFAAAPVANDEFFCIALGVALGVGVPGHGTVNGSQLASPFEYDNYFYLDSANNRVGIHSSTPTVALDVKGDIKLSGSIIGAGGGIGGGIGTFTGLDVNGNADISGNLNVGGVLTYEDVTNVDAIGIITAREGIHLGAGATVGHLSTVGVSTIASLTIKGALDANGVSTFAANVSIADKIIHTGDTDTALRFPTADTITAEVGGSEITRITSSGLGINVTPNRELHVKGLDAIVRVESTSATGRNVIEFFDSSAAKGSIGWPASGNDHMAIQQSENADMWFSTNDTERLRIDSSGKILIGRTSSGYGGCVLAAQAPSGAAASLLLHRGGNASNTNVLGIIHFNDQNDYTGCQIRATANENWSASAHGSYLSFYTTDNTTTTNDERLRIKSDGHIEQTVGADNIGFDQVAASSHYITNVINANRSGAGDHILIQQGQWNGKDVAALKFKAGADTTNKDDGVITFETSSANNQAERMRIDSSGRVLIGATARRNINNQNANAAGDTPTPLLYAEGTGDSKSLTIVSNNTNAWRGSVLGLARTRGTSVGANTIIADNDNIGQIVFAAADGTDLLSNTATIRADIDGTPGANNVPGRLVFSTTADNAVTATERLRINSSGLVNIGAGANTAMNGSGLKIYWATYPALQLQNSTTGTNNTDGSEILLSGDSHSGLFINNRENSIIRFGTNNTEHLRIHSDGKLTIADGTRCAETSTGGLLIDKDITAESDVSSKAGYHLVIRSQTNSNTSKIGLAFANTTDDTHVGAAILHHRTAADSVGALSFYTSPTAGTTTERLRITSNGGVKFISMDSPASTTEPAQWLNHSGGMQLYGSSGSSTHRNIIFCSASNAASERLRITSTGQIGLAVTPNWGNSAYNGLHVHSSGGTNAYVTLTNNATGSTSSSDGFSLAYSSTDINFLNRENGNMLFTTNGATRFHIDSSGSLYQKLEAADTGCIRFFRNTYQAGMISRLVFDTSGGGNPTDSGTYAACVIGARTATNDGSSELRFTTCRSANSYAARESMRVDENQRVRIGDGAIATPLVSNGGLDVSASYKSIVMGGSSDSDGMGRANSTNKEARLCIPHYTNAEEPLGALVSFMQSGQNHLRLGGGTSLCNAATHFYVFTATNVTTTSGTNRFYIDKDGRSKFSTNGTQLDADYTGVTNAPLYVAMSSGVTDPSNNGIGGVTDAFLRLHENGGNSNRYHGLELRNRDSGDIRIMNKDVGASDKATFVLSIDGGNTGYADNNWGTGNCRARVAIKGNEDIYLYGGRSTSQNFINIVCRGSSEPYGEINFINADSNNHANAYRINFWEGNKGNTNESNGWIRYDAATTYGGDGSIIVGGYCTSANTSIAVFNRERNTILLGNRLSIKSSTAWTGANYPGNTTSTTHTGAVFKFDGEVDGLSGLAVGSAKEPFIANRIGSDGMVIRIRQDANTEGSINVSGGTVSYNQFMGAHIARLPDNSKPTILEGTIMETVDQLVTWKYASFSVGVGTDATTKYTPYYGTKNDGETDTIAFDSNTYTATIKNHRETLPETNKRVCAKVSDTVGSKAVFGVFHEWDADTVLERESTNLEYAWNDMKVASIGNYFIRMQDGQTPEIGDYVESAGDGTAKVQSDDILRSKTIAKITSTVKQKTYSDNSFLVTCTLHCG